MNTITENWPEDRVSSSLTALPPSYPKTSNTAASPLWLPVVGFIFVAACLFFLAGYRLDPLIIIAELTVYVIVTAISHAAVTSGTFPRLGWALAGMTLAAAISTGAMMLTYVAASSNMPFVDDKLLLFDRTVGYDWQSYAVFIHGHPDLAELLLRSYKLIYVFPIITIYLLAWKHDFRQINRFLVASMISLTLTAAIFSLCPALTAWDYLGVDPLVIRQLKWLPDATSGWEQNLLEIRAGRGFMLSDVAGSGLIAFPSYHCVAGLLFVWALWPLRPLRIPVTTASSLLIVATPIFGGHYVADLVGGLVVTIVSIVATLQLERWLLFKKTFCRKEPV